MKILLAQITDELNEYLRLLTRFENPIYLSIFITIILFFTIYFIIKYVVIPRERIYRKEKKKLEKKNLELMALFTELNPDPMLRLDHKGNIIQYNDAAKLLDGRGLINGIATSQTPASISGRNIKSVIPGLPFDIEKDIDDTPAYKGVYEINKRKYSIHIRNVLPYENILLYLRDITESLEYEEKLMEISRHYREFFEIEKRRIAGELHDNINQNLSLLKLNLSGLMGTNGNSSNVKEIGSSINILDKTIEDVKLISYNLKPRALDEMGFIPAVYELSVSTSERTGIKFTPDVIGETVHLPGYIETALYRILQEAINNVIKHSNADECSIKIEYIADKIKLLIADDGVGFDLKKISISNKNSLGLYNIKQRIEDFNGKVKFVTEPGQGTVILIEIPMEAQYAGEED